jgi:hypothetical protein
MLLADAADLALDRARGLILAVVLVRRGPDDETLLLDRVGGFRGLGYGTLAEQGTEKGHRRSPMVS